MSFRELYERGELSKEEYDRVLRRVAERVGAKPKPVPVPAGRTPRSPPPGRPRPRSRPPRRRGEPACAGRVSRRRIAPNPFGPPGHPPGRGTDARSVAGVVGRRRPHRGRPNRGLTAWLPTRPAKRAAASRPTRPTGTATPTAPSAARATATSAPSSKGPGDVYICGECIELCQSIIDQEKRRRGGTARRSFTDIPAPRTIKEKLDQYVIGQQRAKKVLSVAVHNHYKRLVPGRRGRGDVEVEKSQHPPHRPDRQRQDPAGPDAGQDPRRPVRHRRRHHADRGRLRRRGRREPAAEAPARGRLRHRGGPARHHLHRRDRQDRQDQPERLDHPRRVRRGRAAGPAEDARRHGRQRPAAGRPEAPRAAVHPGRHVEHPVHLRRDVRRPATTSSPAGSASKTHRLRRQPGAPRAGRAGRPARAR